MRLLRLIFPALVILAITYSCTSSTEDTEPAPDFSSLITGTYAFTTSQQGNTTGSGTAIITKENNTSIRITLEDGISFKANKLQKIDNDLVMEVPDQAVDHYQMDARYAGIRSISREGTNFQGVYFGSTGELDVALRITINNSSDDVLLVLRR